MTAGIIPPAGDVQEMYTSFMGQLNRVTELQSQTAVTLERVNGSINAHDARLKALEDARKASPAALRGWLGIVIAVGSGCLIPTAIAIFSALVALGIHFLG